MLYVCGEHVELALDIIVDEYEKAPELLTLEQAGLVHADAEAEAEAEAGAGAAAEADAPAGGQSAQKCAHCDAFAVYVVS